MEVWKFPFATKDVQELTMPRGARLLHVAVQQEQLCLWALVRPDESITVRRRIRVVGTGQEISANDSENYVGTAMLLGGDLVWHVFDLGESGNGVVG
jgi:hypothetical protein